MSQVEKVLPHPPSHFEWQYRRVEERLIGLGMVSLPYIKLKRQWAQTVSIDVTCNPIHVCTVQPWNLRRIIVTLTPAATLFLAK